MLLGDHAQQKTEPKRKEDVDEDEERSALTPYASGAPQWGTRMEMRPLVEIFVAK